MGLTLTNFVSKPPSILAAVTTCFAVNSDFPTVPCCKPVFKSRSISFTLFRMLEHIDDSDGGYFRYNLCRSITYGMDDALSSARETAERNFLAFFARWRRMYLGKKLKGRSRTIIALGLDNFYNFVEMSS